MQYSMEECGQYKGDGMIQRQRYETKVIGMMQRQLA
jgi:hypothetical protein